MTRPTPKAFILDDSKPMRTTLALLLEEVGYEVFASEEWSVIGRKIMALREPAVLLSDLHMPGIRGVDFCHTVLKHKRTVGIVLISGDDAGLERARRSLGPGVYCSQKSTSPNKLLAIVSEAFREARARHDAASAEGDAGPLARPGSP